LKIDWLELSARLELFRDSPNITYFSYNQIKKLFKECSNLYSWEHYSWRKRPDVIEFEKTKFDKWFENHGTSGIRKYYRELLELVQHCEIDKINYRNKIKVKYRAEEYTLDEIKYQKSLNTKFKCQIDNHLTETKNYPLYVLGEKGFGKTFNVLKSAIEHSNADKHPSMFMFKQNEKVELYSPFENKITSDYKIEQVIKNSDTIIFDDIHYLCEYVIDGKLEVDVLLNVLKNALKVSKEKRNNIILISEDQLGGYAEIINNKNLYELLPFFGEFRQHENIKTYKDYLTEKNKINYLAQLVVPKPEIDEYRQMLIEFGLTTDEYTSRFLYRNASGNFRGILKFMKHFKSKNIEMPDLINVAVTKLKNPNLIKLCMELPLIDVEINYNQLESVGRHFKTFGQFEKHILNQISSISEIKKQMRSLSTELKERNMVTNIIKTYLDGINKSKTLEGIIRKYKGLHKILSSDKDFDKLQNLMPELLLKKYKYRYYGLYASLKGIEKALNMSDKEFTDVMKNIPKNYIEFDLDRPLRMAFKEVFEEVM